MSDSCWYHPDLPAYNACDRCTRTVCEEDLRVINKLVLDQEFIPHKSTTIGYSLCPICIIDNDIRFHSFTVTSIVAKIMLQFIMYIIALLIFASEDLITIIVFGIPLIALWGYLTHRSFIHPRRQLKILKEKKQKIIKNPSSV